MIRSLLSVGTSKLSRSIYHWSIPANRDDVCPGRTPICSAMCYTNFGRFLTKAVQDRYEWCLEQALRDDFAQRMIEEVKEKGAFVIRIHVSGDLFSSEYVAKWVEIIEKCRKTRFFGYTRSYRIPAIEPSLHALAALKNMRLWYSLDVDTGVPPVIPPRVKLAFMQHDERKPDQADLVFRTRAMRKRPRVGLKMVCPQETNKKVNCANCSHCFD
jgi:hypothetical protein